MEYSKPFLTFDNQADLLLSRGMVGDKHVIVEHLTNVGYYRLSGYWHIFKNDSDRFAEGTLFEDVWHLYVFDRQLRLVVLDAVERVEIYFRTQLSYQLARETGVFGYANPNNLPRLSRENYDKFIDRCKESLSRSREPFVVHFKEKYGDSHELPPYWMLVNVMDYGMMLTLYRGAPIKTRNNIARDLGIPAKVLESWLVTLNTTRNICAHHGRLWNRRLGTVPMIPKTSEDARWKNLRGIQTDKIAGVLTILSYLLERVAPDTHWRERLFSLIDSESDETLFRMGFTEGWQECPLWSNHIE